jgi:hypothetical protein
VEHQPVHDEEQWHEDSDNEVAGTQQTRLERKAAKATDRFVKDKFLEIAQEWQELSLRFRSTAAEQSESENWTRWRPIEVTLIVPSE